MENDSTVFQNPGSGGGKSSPSGQIPPPDFLTPPKNYSQVFNSGQTKQNQPPPDFTQSVTYREPSSGGFSRLKKFLKIFSSVFIILGLVFLIISFLFPGINRTQQNQVTLAYWGLFEDPSVMQGIITDFEKQYPYINVEYVKQDSSQYRDRLTTRIQNGNGPDIFWFHNTWYPMLKNYLLPLPSQTMSQDEFNSIYYPVAQKDLIKNGAIFGIPLETDTLALFVNTQLLQAAGVNIPTNWNEFVDAARAMTVKDANGNIKTAGAAIGTYSNVTHAADIISLLFLQNGVDFNNFQASENQVSGALTFYTSFAKGDNVLWDNTLDPSQLAFAKGNLGMYFGYPSDYFAIKQYNPNLNFQIAPVPQLTGQNVTLASYWAAGVSVRSVHQKEALLFIKYLSEKETEQKLYAQEAKISAFGQPYARMDLADSLKNNPLVYPFVSQAQTAASSPFIEGTYDDGLNQQLDSELQDVVNLYLQPTGSAPQSADDFVKKVVQTLQQYGQ